MSFPKLFSVIIKSMPTSYMNTLEHLYAQYKVGKIGKDIIVRNVRMIVGDKLLIAAIQSIRGQIKCTQMLNRVEHRPHSFLGSDRLNLDNESTTSTNKEKLQAIEKGQQEYTLGEEEKREQEAILKSDCTLAGSVMLRKSLSRRYLDMDFEEALQIENDKLQNELQRLETRHETEQCDVIKHLIDFTEAAVTVTSESGELKLNKNYQQTDFHFDDSSKWLDILVG